ncbi:uncharacterized protein LOC127806389 [Diospyros lotus]|uniref:uncharacterized protein LOC127806389 n=1 Tax=Diospyros lotus TaxID=55363 RepID=UPI002259CD01|nr:uncharacterized protein LOC127806389 [Diospyros lotus]
MEQEQQTQNNQRTLSSYATPTLDGTTSSIRRPNVQANNFEIKPAIIQMIQMSVQFSGPNDDPNSHIANFLEICDTFRHNGVSEDAVRLRLFPFSLKDRAKEWLNSLPADATAGGTLMRKTPEEAYELLEEMAANSYQWDNERANKKGVGIYNVDSITALSVQIAELNKNLGNLGVSTMNASSSSSHFLSCELCGRGGHASVDCQVGNPFSSSLSEQANFISYGGNRSNFNPYSNTYNPGWRSHPNLSWSNNQQRVPPGFQQQQHQIPQEKKSNLEDMMAKFINSTEARMQSLETQIGQLAQAISERPQGGLPSNTEKNPREHVKAITLRSGKELESKEKDEKHSTEEESQEHKAKEEDRELSTEKNGSSSSLNLKYYKIPLPFPKRFLKANLDKKFAKFLKVFKKLHINIPLLDVISQMPSYAKFLKDIIANKRKLEEFEIVKLNEECSAILQNKLPPKLKDSGSFSIPCTIGEIKFDKVLCDLGASINLMPFSVFGKLGLQEPTPTTISLQLADRSIKYPRGVVEDVLVKVDKFIFPVDFIVLDMEEDYDMPLILERPFLAIGRALIDVQQGTLSLRIYDKTITFNVFKAT